MKILEMLQGAYSMVADFKEKQEGKNSELSEALDDNESLIKTNLGLQRALVAQKQKTLDLEQKLAEYKSRLRNND